MLSYFLSDSYNTLAVLTEQFNFVPMFSETYNFVPLFTDHTRVDIIYSPYITCNGSDSTRHMFIWDRNDCTGVNLFKVFTDYERHRVQNGYNGFISTIGPNTLDNNLQIVNLTI
ncbi:MAG: hypothetical protein EOP34_03105 [Rickettsiales bacterium]|nr:MAG: hypothetical protein EOP34_03105 [Rickettsiales bacterium]